MFFLNYQYDARHHRPTQSDDNCSSGPWAKKVTAQLPDPIGIRISYSFLMKADCSLVIVPFVLLLLLFWHLQPREHIWLGLKPIPSEYLQNKAQK